MSGGEYNYVFFKIQEIDIITGKEHVSPERLAFQQLLRLVSNVMRTVEWVDSCDKSPGDEDKEIAQLFAALSSDPKKAIDELAVWEILHQVGQVEDSENGQ